MCARSALCSFKIVEKGFSLHYFLSHPWIWWFSDLSYKSVLLSKVELRTESYCRQSRERSWFLYWIPIENI